MKTSDKQAAADRNDLTTAIVVGALIVLFLLYDGVRRIAALFAEPGRITVHAPVPADEVTIHGVPATVGSAVLSAEGAGLATVVSLVLSILVSMIGLGAVAVLGVLVCRRLSRGIVFDAVNTRLMFAISMCLLAAGLGGVGFKIMGLNGVFAALGWEFDDQLGVFLQAVPMYVAAMAIGVVVIIFRRGAALQRETEGLV